MELANIERLLEKYLEAETSIAEEKELSAYFSSQDVAPHLEQYKMMFQYFTDAKNETYNKTVPLKPGKRNYYKWMSVAAVVILSVGFTTSYIVEKRQEKKARQAYYETKNALQLLSSKFNNGAEKVAYLNEFEKTKNQIFKSNN